MKFGEKIKNIRLKMNLTQVELAEKIGVTDRSVYSYERNDTMPRSSVLNKLVEVLGVTASYLFNEDETGKQPRAEHKLFFDKAKKEFGYKGAREAQEIVSRAAALFAGGDLNDKAKDYFFQSLTEVYFESKAEAREKFSPKKRVSRSKS